MAKWVDANEIIEVLEKDLEKMPRASQYEEGWVAGVRQVLLVLKLMPEGKEGTKRRSRGNERKRYVE